MLVEATQDFIIPDMCLARGIAFSSGTEGAEIDLIEAHVWFNLAALHGHSEAGGYRAEVAGEMTPGQITQAQRRARAMMIEGLFLSEPKGFC